jgi:hypothetical protein
MVEIIVPTTILIFTHFNTTVFRLHNLPVIWIDVGFSVALGGQSPSRWSRRSTRNWSPA